MMLVKGGGIGGLLLLIFFIWVFLGPNPQDRINRTCKPVSWAGNISESVVALTFPSFISKITKTFSRFEYGCQYSVWRMFYEKEFLEKTDDKESS